MATRLVPSSGRSSLMRYVCARCEHQSLPIQKHKHFFFFNMPVAGYTLAHFFLTLSSRYSTVWTQPALTTVTATSSSSASTCISTKPLVAVTCLALSLWIWSLVPWTRCALVLSVSCSALTTLSSARLAPATTGPRATTPRVLSSLTRCSTWCARKLNHAIAYRASS